MTTARTARDPSSSAEVEQSTPARDLRHRLSLPLRKAGFLLTALLSIYLMLWMLLHPWYANWGATDTEQRQALPGDEYVPAMRAQMTRAITINAPTEDIWPWLVQMGVDRAGLYTYTWFENGVLRLNVTNADEIIPEWQDLSVGDIVAYTPEEYPSGRWGPTVIALEPNGALIMCAGGSTVDCPRTWQIVLQEQPDGTTRLYSRWRSSADASRLGFIAEMPLDIGNFVMERKMLLGIKERAEKAKDAE